MERTEWAFERFCQGLGLRHFAAPELLTKCGRPDNAVPPARLWPNIVPTILVADRLRATVEAPVVVLSGYRTPAYNARIGGATTSQHLAFGALDIACAGAEPEALRDLLVGWRGGWFDCPADLEERGPADTPAGPTPFRPLETKSQGRGCRFRWRGGIGLYETFIHIDSRGYDASW